MPIKYPIGPPPKGLDEPEELRLRRGEGINIKPDEASTFLDFTAAMGTASANYYALISQLDKWGFDVVKIEEAIEVSPVFTRYFQVTIRQKRELEERIKAGLTSIATAISDFELVLHDLRKYKEYMDYFTKIERGKKLIKEGKAEEGKKLIEEGEASLRSVFLEQVDIHTGEGIALRSAAMVKRFPTIISDFMKLGDEDKDAKGIVKKLNVTEAEGTLLATKNLVYLEWRDNLFRPTIERRYKNIYGLVEARRKSIEDYKRMLRPVIARHEAIREMVESPAVLQRVALWRPDAQAISIDHTRLWAWAPFAPIEKFKVVKEAFDMIAPSKAGFRHHEIMELRKELGEGWDGLVEALPLEPSIDRVVRKFMPKIAKEWGVKLGTIELYKARKMLTEKFKASWKSLLPWVFSPYYTFIELPIARVVIVLPNGVELEIMDIDNLSSSVQTQNLIILHCLEVIARDKRTEQRISQLLGERGVKEPLPVEELAEREYPEIYEKVEEVKRPLDELRKGIDRVKVAIESALTALGLDVLFLRIFGPYESHFEDRIKKFYLPQASKNFKQIVGFLKSGFKIG